MEDSHSYHKQHSQMIESLWYLRQQSRCLQDYRSDIKEVWSDDAASEINRRYLDPHAQDSRRSIQYLDEQSSSIDDANREFDLANSAGMEATKLAQEIEQLLQSAHRDLSRARSEYAMYQERHLAACAQIANTEMLISQAGEYPK